MARNPSSKAEEPASGHAGFFWTCLAGLSQDFASPSPWQMATCRASDREYFISIGQLPQGLSPKNAEEIIMDAGTMVSSGNPSGLSPQIQGQPGQQVRPHLRSGASTPSKKGKEPGCLSPNPQALPQNASTVPSSLSIKQQEEGTQ